MDRAGRTPLHYAALENNVARVARLVADGTDVDASDNLGFTALHFACEHGAVEAARALLDAGAEVDGRDSFGRTPLLAAVTGAPPVGELVQLLRDHGADPCAVDSAGRTAVSVARERVSVDLARYFEDVPDPPCTCDEVPLPGCATAETGTADWGQEYQRLWDELVPPRGQAFSVQGELIRCIGRLTDEAYRNGNQNWVEGSGHERMLAYIERTLLEDASITLERRAAIRKDLARMGDYARPDVGGPGTCYYNIAEAVVGWCREHPALIPREPDPELGL